MVITIAIFVSATYDMVTLVSVTTFFYYSFHMFLSLAGTSARIVPWLQVFLVWWVYLPFLIVLLWVVAVLPEVSCHSFPLTFVTERSQRGIHSVHS